MITNTEDKTKDLVAKKSDVVIKPNIPENTDDKIKNFGLIPKGGIEARDILKRLEKHGYKHTSDMHQSQTKWASEAMKSTPKDVHKKIDVWPIEYMDEILQLARNRNLTTDQFKLSFNDMLTDRQKDAINHWAFKNKRENFINTAVEIYRDELAKEKESSGKIKSDETASTSNIPYSEPDKIYGEMRTASGRVVKFNKKEFEDVKDNPIKAKAFIDKLKSL